MSLKDSWPVYDGGTLRTDEGNTVKREQDITLITETAHVAFTTTVLQQQQRRQLQLQLQ